MAFALEHECPQCGAPVELAETDRLLACPYCAIRNYLATDELVRFALGPPPEAGEPLWAPYLRFKGSVFVCADGGVTHRVLDLSRLALASSALPESLGLRPQTQKLRFLRPELPGRFLQPAFEPTELVTAAAPGPGAVPASATVYVGEVTSVVYAPLIVDARQVRDGLNGEAVARLPAGVDLTAHAATTHPATDLTVLPALCPDCGFDLEGEGASAVLTCGNCDSAWEPAGDRFVARAVETEPAHAGDEVHLPFWRMRARATGVALETVADFERLTNQRVLPRRSAGEGFVFWSPAFKITPGALLRLAGRLTLAQRPPCDRPEVPRGRRHPVTLPLAAAARTMLVTLADLAMAKHEVFPRLGEITLAVKDATLVYLPFRDAGSELVRPEAQLAVSRSALEFGRRL